jgi:CDP-diacylglycerol--serine O-phosphatidyltransferase
LARFNVNTAIVDKRYFQGLPSPAAAALVVGFMWMCQELGVAGRDVVWVMFAVTLYAGLTMVTNVPFYSFKDMRMKKTVPFVVLVAIAVVISLISLQPPLVLFGIFVLYGFSGYVVLVSKRMRGQRVSVISTSIDEPDEKGLHQ